MTNPRRTSENHKKPEHPGHQIQVGSTRGNFQRTPWKQSDLQNQGTGTGMVGPLFDFQSGRTCSFVMYVLSCVLEKWCFDS